MTADDQAATLADQAASWVPPWARQPEPECEAPETGPGVVAAGSGAVAADSGPAGAEPAGDASADAQAEVAVMETVAVVPAQVGGGPSTAAEAGGGVDVAADDGDAGPAETIDSAGGPLSDSEPVAAAGPEPVAAAGPEPAVGDPAPAESVEPMEPVELRGALEAILLVVDEPVTEVMLAQVLEQPTERIAATLAELSAEYTEQGRGFELRKVAGGWRLYTRGEYAAYVERFVLDGQQVRLTQAALETLAVVAYKQPVTRSRISAIRGVNCDGVIRTLIARGLVEECGSEPDSGAFLYRTTALFLEKLGLDRIEELPPLAPFLPDDVEEIANAQG